MKAGLSGPDRKPEVGNRSSALVRVLHTDDHPVPLKHVRVYIMIAWDVPTQRF